LANSRATPGRHARRQKAPGLEGFNAQSPGAG
jgi:hypothetical protein